MLRSYFGVADADDAAARREKVRPVLTALDPSLSDGLPYLFALLGIVEGTDPLAQMDAQIKRQRTLDAIKHIVLSESLKQPVVVIFEDLHWIDAQTQALLDLLADSVANSRVLLLFNYRPEYRHEWTNKSYYSQLRLDPLDWADGAAMLGALLGESVELNALKRLIAERTSGNPFFIEEIVQALFDEGALVRNGAVKVTRSLSQLRLPPTVQGILASRIDRQPSEHKQLLQTLAVIGRESSLGLIRQVATSAEAQLERMLADLQAGEFIYEQPATTGVEYVFKHALTQEVAYGSLLIERRKQLHEDTGCALESMFAGQLDDHLSQLAYHYARSSNREKAFEYAQRAAEQAAKRSAGAEAIAQIRAALDLLSTFPDSPDRKFREVGLLVLLGGVLPTVAMPSDPQNQVAWSRARELCLQIKDDPRISSVLTGLWLFYEVAGELSIANELANELVRLAERTGNRVKLASAHAALGHTAISCGQFVGARNHLEQSLDLCHLNECDLSYFTADSRPYSLTFLGEALWLLGFPDQAVATRAAALAELDEIVNPFSGTLARIFLGQFSWLMGNRKESSQLADAIIMRSTKHGFGFPLTQGSILRGWSSSEHSGMTSAASDMKREYDALPGSSRADIAAPPAEINGTEYAPVAAKIVEDVHPLQSGIAVQRASKAFESLKRVATTPGIEWTLRVYGAEYAAGYGVRDGSVFVTTALVDRLDDGQLTAVLAHLMGHERYQHARHAARRHNTMAPLLLGPSVMFLGVAGAAGPQASNFVWEGLRLTVKGAMAVAGDLEILSYTPAEELEANREATKYLAQLGIPPEQLVTGLRRAGADASTPEPAPMRFAEMHHADRSAFEFARALDAGIVR